MVSWCHNDRASMQLRLPCKRHTSATEHSCLRDAFMFFLWHTSRHQPIAVISSRCRSRADNLQRGTVEVGRVTPCAQEQLTWSQCGYAFVVIRASLWWRQAWWEMCWMAFLISTVSVTAPSSPCVLFADLAEISPKLRVKNSQNRCSLFLHPACITY